MAFSAPAFVAPASPVGSSVLALDAPLRVAQVPVDSASTDKGPQIRSVHGVALLALGGFASHRLSRKHRRAANVVARRFFAKEVQKPKGPLALPMLPEPEYRQYADPFLAEADVGFDPLNLASTTSPFGDGKAAYWNYREAEVKHGRLAMLAALGWIAAETFQPQLAARYGLPDELATGELAPSILNGGLLGLPSLFLPVVVMIASWIELAPQRKDARSSTVSYKPQIGRVPGDYGFDPLDLEVQIRSIFGYDKVWLHNAELKHGRLGMLAITAFVAQEVLLKIPVLRQDERGVDVAVEQVDQAIDAIDRLSGLSIPDVPVPFPGA
jgi:light-harvesting complex II chlorophyll a/b binding protein 5